MRAVAALRARALAAAAARASGADRRGDPPRRRVRRRRPRRRAALRRDPRPAARAAAPDADVRAARPRRDARRGDGDPRLQRPARVAAAAAGAGGELPVLARRRLAGWRRRAPSCSAATRAATSRGRSRRSTTSSRASPRVVAAGDAPDYTFLWWDIRPHPSLGTVEVRAMDAQSSLGTVLGLVALVHGLALRRRGRARAGRRLDAARGADGVLVPRRPRRPRRDAAARRRPAPGRARSPRTRWRARPPPAATPPRWRRSRASSQLGNGADRQRAAFATRRHAGAARSTSPPRRRPTPTSS